MRLVATSAGAGARVEQYGRGKRHAGEQDPTSLSHCDPFLGTATYAEPDYDPFWYCTDPPDWDNVRCVPSGDIPPAELEAAYYAQQPAQPSTELTHQ
jgi:hypothetical protein